MIKILSKKSSSIHGLNADDQLSRFWQKLYFILNRWNNRKPLSNVDSNICINYFRNIDASLENVNKRSPSRYMSDLFWKQLDWNKLEKGLSELKLMDLGCGKGGYLEYWTSCSSNRIKNYIGFDIKRRESWIELEKKYPFASFQEHQASAFKKSDLDNSNILFSQSVLEHIDDDVYFFKKLSSYLKKRKEPFVQIHLAPTTSGLEKWRLHGVRQYTPRTISRITKLFPNCKIDLLAMGGETSNKVHLDYITYPLASKRIDFRDTKEVEYENKVKEAITFDLNSESIEKASFLALIIQHNCDIDLVSTLTEKTGSKISSIAQYIVLNPKSIALDLGANIGNITHQMAETGASVYAFEPNPFAFEKLQQRFKDNPKVTCLNKAVLDIETTIPLYFHEFSDQDEITWSVGSSLLDFKKNVLKGKKVDVEALDLAVFIKNLGKPIDLIKMDIEGVECKVINHLIDSEVMDSIKLMLVETHDHKIPELKEETDALRSRIKALGLENKINLNWI